MARYEMGTETLATLATQSTNAHEDLGVLVQQLFDAAEPMTRSFQGEARTAFDAFKAEADLVAKDLNHRLDTVVQGIRGQDAAFKQGEQQQVDEIRSGHAAVASGHGRFGHS